MCGCAQRRTAIITAAKAVARGDAATAAAQAGFVARSTGQDARAGISAVRLALAKTRIGR